MVRNTLIVPDASVVIKWLVDEEPEETKRSREILYRFQKDKSLILCPSLILYEISNALAMKRKISDHDVYAMWKLFLEVDVPLFNPTSEFISKALEFARKYQVTVYDASYAVLAKEKKGIFITADKVFVKQVKESFVELL